MSSHKILSLVVSGVALLGSAFIVAQALTSLDRRPLRATQALLEAGATGMTDRLKAGSQGLGEKAAQLAASKELPNALRQYVNAVKAVRPGADPLPFQQSRIDKAREKLNELRNELGPTGPHQVVLINEEGMVVSSESPRFTEMQLALLPGENAPEDEEAPTSWVAGVLAGKRAERLVVGGDKLHYLGAAPIPHPTNRKKTSGAVLVERSSITLPPAAGVESFLVVGGQPVMGEAPSGFTEPSQAPEGSVLLQTTEPLATVSGLFEMSTPGFLPRGKQQPGIWGQRFSVPGVPQAWGYVVADVSSVYSQIRGLQVLTFLLAIIAWGVVGVLIILDGRAMRRGVVQLADFLAKVQQNATDERAINEAKLPKPARRLGKLVNQLLEQSLAAPGLKPLSQAPTVEQVLQEASARSQETIPTGDQPPDFDNLSFEGISNSGSLDASELQSDGVVVAEPDDQDGYDSSVAEIGAELLDAEVEEEGELPTDDALAAVDTLGVRGGSARTSGESEFSAAGEAEFGGFGDDEETTAAAVELSPPNTGNSEAGISQLPSAFDDGPEASPALAELEPLEELDTVDEVEALEEADAEELLEVPTAPSPHAVTSLAQAMDAQSTAVMKPSAAMLEELKALAQQDQQVAQPQATPAAPMAPSAPASPALMAHEDSDATAVMKVTPELLAQMKATAEDEQAEAAQLAPAPAAPASPSVPQALDSLSDGSTAVMKVSPELLAQMKATAAAEQGAQAAAGAPASPAPASPAPVSPSPAPAAAAPAAPAAGPGNGSQEAHFRQVFNDFMNTRRECGETGELDYNKFAKRLEQSRVAVMAKHQCSDVRFQVYVKNGKAALKATPAK